MKIGELATLTGTTPDTLRYYERQGLLARPGRAANGYRRYDSADAARVRFVRSAQALGFTLAEIAALLPGLAGGQLPLAAVLQRLDDKLADIEAHMRRLRALRDELRAVRGSLTCDPGQPVSLAQVTRTPTKGTQRTQGAQSAQSTPATQAKPAPTRGPRRRSG